MDSAPEPAPPRRLNKAAAAAYAKRSPRTIQRWLNDGRLAHTRDPHTGQVWIPEDALRAALAEERIARPSNPPSRARPPRKAPPSPGAEGGDIVYGQPNAVSLDTIAAAPPGPTATVESIPDDVQIDTSDPTSMDMSIVKVDMSITALIRGAGWATNLLWFLQTRHNAEVRQLRDALDAQSGELTEQRQLLEQQAARLATLEARLPPPIAGPPAPLPWWRRWWPWGRTDT